jgi:hypothetical protein
MAKIERKNNGDIAVEKEKIADILIRGIVEGFVLDGKINPRGKSEEDLQKEVLSLLKKAAKGDPQGQFFFATDHTSEILQQVRNFVRSGKLENSCLFYAMWFEHWLNSLIVTIGRRKKFKEDEITQIIRETQFKGKTTWLLRLLGLNPINKSHLKRMQLLIEARNSYVHYKWKFFDVDDNSPERERTVLKDLLKDIEKTVSYLRKLENKQFFHNKKKKLLPKPAYAGVSIKPRA